MNEETRPGPPIRVPPSNVQRLELDYFTTLIFNAAPGQGFEKGLGALLGLSDAEDRKAKILEARRFVREALDTLKATSDCVSVCGGDDDETLAGFLLKRTEARRAQQKTGMFKRRK